MTFSQSYSFHVRRKQATFIGKSPHPSVGECGIGRGMLHRRILFGLDQLTITCRDYTTGCRKFQVYPELLVGDAVKVGLCAQE